MISRDSIETAYALLHQKRNVYIHSRLSWQRDDIELAVASFTDAMSPELYALLSAGRPDYLRDHARFGNDLARAVEQLEAML